MRARLRLRLSGRAARFVYDDQLSGFIARTSVAGETRRASHVEPSGDGWTADMSPVGGPVLGPFQLRGEALDAELDWLATERGL